MNSRQVVSRNYHGEIEYFAVYCPDTDGVYFISIDEATSGDGCLRVEAPLNNQTKRIRWARDYEL